VVFRLQQVEFVLDKGITDEQAKLLIATTTKNSHCAIIDNDPLQLRQQQTPKQGFPVATKTMLSNVHAVQVLVQTCPIQYEKPRYFYMVDFTLAVTQCSSCNHFFEQEELDLAMLEYGSCPFCGVSPNVPLISNNQMIGIDQAKETLLPLLPLPSSWRDASQLPPAKALLLESKKNKAMDSIKLQKEPHGLFCMTRHDLVSRG